MPLASMISRRREARGERREARGEWRVASGEWRVASGEWRVASGEWRVGPRLSFGCVHDMMYRRRRAVSGLPKDVPAG